jgi:hypothetical protein
VRHHSIGHNQPDGIHVFREYFQRVDAIGRNQSSRAPGRSAAATNVDQTILTMRADARIATSSAAHLLRVFLKRGCVALRDFLQDGMLYRFRVENLRQFFRLFSKQSYDLFVKLLDVH